MIEESGLSQASSRVILIADNNAFTQQLSRQLLRRQEHQIIETGDDLQAPQRHLPNLVLLEAEMIQIDDDSSQALKQISQNHFWSIVLLVNLEDRLVEQTFAPGVTDDGMNPFNWTALRQRIQRLLQASREPTAELETLVQERTAELQAQIEALELLIQIKDDSINTVSHELRSPLSNMRMSIQMLEQFLSEAAQNFSSTFDRQIYLKGQAYLQILKSECERGSDFIDDLLDLQKLESVEFPQFTDAILLQDWIFQTLAPFVERAQQRQQTLKIQLNSDLPPILTSTACLRRILSELLQNACKYTPPTGTIVVTAEIISDRFYIKVSNSGVEISTEEANQIFDRFYQIPGSDLWNQGGTGLGLAIVKRLVSQLNGAIEVESETGWVHFTVNLPAM